MKKGFTLIELLISISLLTIVLIFMLSLLLKLTEKRESNGDLNLFIDQALMSKKINSDIYNYNGLSSITCGDALNCIFNFNNGTEKHITISTNQKTISYGTTSFNDFVKVLPEDYTYDAISLVKNTYTNGDLVKIIIPVTDHPEYNLEVYYYGNYNFAAGDSFYFSYTGNYQTFTVPASGTYKIELWGAQGGGTYGAKGGYTSGNINLVKDQVLYIYVGQNASQQYGGWNGGGNMLPSGISSSGLRLGSAGGGATDVRLISGTWDNSNSLISRIMVAGGGGGYGYVEYSGAGVGGGLTGGASAGTASVCVSRGGTQTAGGYYNCGADSQNSGVFGKGGTTSASVTPVLTTGGGGGGGYYGGGGNVSVSNDYQDMSGGGGGSSFISGLSGCNAVNESGVSTGQPNHYSEYIFSNGQTIAGNALMPTPMGSTETGHTGNGFAKITLISLE